MSAKNNYFKIGMFVLAAVAILVIGLIAFGARGFFAKKLPFETSIVGEVQGLSVGSAVELRGVPVGQVTMIGFSWNEYPSSTNGSVIVRFQVEKSLAPSRASLSFEQILDERVKSGLRAVVKSQGITGISIVSLQYLNATNYPPPEIDFQPRDFYIPSAPSSFTRMLDSIEKSLSNIQKVDFAAISEGITNVLDVVHRFAEKLEELDLKRLAGNADGLIVDLKGTSGTLRETLEEIRTNLKRLNLEALGKNAEGLVSGLRESNLKLQTVLDRLGTVPLQETVSDVRQTVETLNGVLLELKQYPSGFLFGQPPPPAKGVRPPTN